MNPESSPRSQKLHLQQQVQKLVDSHCEEIRRTEHASPNQIPEAIALFHQLVSILKQHQPPEVLLPAIQTVGKIVQNCLQGPSIAPLEVDGWPFALQDQFAPQRLAAALALSELFRTRTENFDSASVIEEVVTTLFSRIVTTPRPLSQEAVVQLEAFCRLAPSLIDEVVSKLQELENSPTTLWNPNSLPSDALFHFLDLSGFVSAVTTSILEHEMPEEVATELIQRVVAIPQTNLRRGLMEKVHLLLESGCVRLLSGDLRLPYPLGRPAAIGAIKTLGSKDYHAIGGPEQIHEFSGVVPPSKKAEWLYIGQRLRSISAGHDSAARGKELYCYLTQVVEMCVARPFFEQTEEYFNQLTLGRQPGPLFSLFFREDYGVDNPPAPEGSVPFSIARTETLQTLRSSAFIRDSINLRKGYARGKRWIFEEIAEEAGARVQRFRVGDIDKYPGPGCRISGLDVRRALDLESKQARDYYKACCPWLRHGIGALHHADIFHMRGFIAISPTFEPAVDLPARTWRRGSIFGKPYVFVWFNDHFHNLHGPEIRTWLVPASVFHRKCVLAVEHPEKIDINLLDLTPEGFLKEAERQQLPILSVSTASVLWGGLANAWPQGQGPAHSWETPTHRWRTTRWQDPFHIHRALFDGGYTKVETPDMRRLFNVAAEEHRRIQAVMRFGHDLYASFLTIEEQVAKGFLRRGAPPPRLRFLGPDKSPLPNPFSSDAMGETAGATSDREGSGPAPESPLDDAISPGEASYTLPRTFLLERFLERRNDLLQKGAEPPPDSFPRLVLDHTRIFRQQRDTPFITGHDLMLHIPGKESIPLVRGAREGVVFNRRVSMDEQMEALYDRHIVPHFRTNNCPRIVLP